MARVIIKLAKQYALRRLLNDDYSIVKIGGKVEKVVPDNGGVAIVSNSGSITHIKDITSITHLMTMYRGTNGVFEMINWEEL